MVRVAGAPTVAENALHACLLLIERNDLNNQLAMGSGSIVSRSRILTAAHVVRGATGVQAGYYLRWVTLTQLRRADSIYVQPMHTFNSQSFEDDLALVIFPHNSFPMDNVIPIALNAPTASASVFVAGYGFDSATSITPLMVPLLASLTMSIGCTDAVAATGSHFCALVNNPAALWPGDNGAGLYTDNGIYLELVKYY